MRPLHFVLIAALLTPAAALAQQRVPPKADTLGDGSARGDDAPRTAVPREAPPPPPPQQPAPPPPQRSQPAPQRSAPPATSASAPDSGSSRAQERQRIPPEARRDGDRRGERQPQGGTAIPRPRGVPPRTGGDSRVYVPGPRVYNNYYYYPRRYYPYGYGAFGLGYFYYDPYSWGPAYGYDPYYQPFRGYGYGYPTGELRLQVRPRDAEVYVDGYYAGRVDDFDGVFQSLTLEEGGYRIEIVAPGFEPLVFDVRVSPGRTVTYRGDLLRRRP